MIAYLLIAVLFLLEFVALFTIFIFQLKQSLMDKEKEIIGVCICEAVLLILAFVAIIGFITAIITEYCSLT